MSDDDESLESDINFREEVRDFEFDSTQERVARKVIHFLDDESFRDAYDLDEEDEEVQHAEILLASFYFRAFLLYAKQVAILVILVAVADFLIDIPAQSYGLVVAMYASFLLATISTEGRYRIAASTMVEDDRLPMLRLTKAQESIETTIAAAFLLLGFGMQLIAILLFG